jgi:hypothetical protein
MNIIEAVKSGKPIRLKAWVDYITIDTHHQFYWMHTNCLHYLDNREILSDDWEIKEDKPEVKEDGK